MPDPSGPTDPSRPTTPRLDRAPGDRYRGDRPPVSGAADGTTSGAGTSGTRIPAARGRTTAVLAAVVVAVVGAILFGLLSQIDLGVGMLVVAMFIGWAVALALVWNGATIPRRGALGAVLGGGAIVGGLLVAWIWGRVEGGALGPLDYVNERYGPLAYLEVVAAGAVAWYRSR
jgi:hypothetical protein